MVHRKMSASGLFTLNECGACCGNSGFIWLRNKMLYKTCREMPHGTYFRTIYVCMRTKSRTKTSQHVHNIA